MLQLHVRGENSESALKAHFPQIANVGQLASDILELLQTSDLISSEKRERIERYSGLKSSSKGDDHAQGLPQLLDSIKSGGPLERSSRKQG